MFYDGSRPLTVGFNIALGDLDQVLMQQALSYFVPAVHATVDECFPAMAKPSCAALMSTWFVFWLFATQEQRSPSNFGGIHHEMWLNGTTGSCRVCHIFYL